MSSFLLWAQRQEISTSHTSKSGMQADSHSQCVLLRRLDCLFGEVVLIHLSNLHNTLMNTERLEKMVQKYSLLRLTVSMLNILLT